MLASGPLSGGFIIDQMLKVFVWDDFGLICIFLLIDSSVTGATPREGQCTFCLEIMLMTASVVPGKPYK